MISLAVAFLGVCLIVSAVIIRNGMVKNARIGKELSPEMAKAMEAMGATMGTLDSFIAPPVPKKPTRPPLELHRFDPPTEGGE